MPLASPSHTPGSITTKMSSSKIIRSPPGSRPDSPAYVPETPVFTSGKPHPTPGIIIPRYVGVPRYLKATDSETDSEIESEIESESESEDEYANCPACRFERARPSDIHVHSHRGCPFEYPSDNEGVPGYDPTAPAYVPAPMPAPVPAPAWEQRSIVASMPGSGALLVARMRRISEEKRRDRMARRMQAFYRRCIKRIRKRIRKRKRDYEIAPPAKRFC